MTKKLFPLIFSFSLILMLAGCNGTSEKQIAEVLKKNPKILAEAIQENPEEILNALQKAAESMRGKMAEKRKEEESKKLEEAYDNPLKPEIRSDETFRGSKTGPITLVEYSDFQCPFCSRAFDTVRTLLEKYDGKIRFVYKHLPLSFHQQAMIASEYYEAIRLQSEDKAFKFHDKVYDEQQKLRTGEPFLKKIAKSIGVDMGRLAKDLKNPKVKERIKEDMAEASKFGFQGTPGFLLNGIPVKGAYPVDHFENIISELKKRGKISL